MAPSKKQSEGSPTKRAALPRPNKAGKRNTLEDKGRRVVRRIQARIASSVTGRKRIDRGPPTLLSNRAKGEYTFKPRGVSTPSKSPVSKQRNTVRASGKGKNQVK